MTRVVTGYYTTENGEIEITYTGRDYPSDNQFGGVDDIVVNDFCLFGTSVDWSMLPIDVQRTIRMLGYEVDFE